MHDTDSTLPDGRRILQPPDFAVALAALNRDLGLPVAVSVTFGHIAGTSGHSGDEIELDDYTHQLLTTLQDPGHRVDPAAVFVDAAIEPAVISLGPLRRSPDVASPYGKAEDCPADWHVHTIENPALVRINRMHPQPADADRVPALG